LQVSEEQQFCPVGFHPIVSQMARVRRKGMPKEMEIRNGLSLEELTRKNAESIRRLRDEINRFQARLAHRENAPQHLRPATCGSGFGESGFGAQ
jgi:hypothetical protein